VPVAYPRLTADEAAALVQDGTTVAFSGFTPAGAAKAVPAAIARRARALHADGKPFAIRVLTGASTGAQLDGELAGAEAISWRAPYQSSGVLRSQINKGQVEFVDMHLSHVAQAVKFGFFGRIDTAVVEATEITPDGRVFLTASVGASPTFLHEAERIIIEINSYHSPRLREITDIYDVPVPPEREPIPLHDPLGRIGAPFVAIDPRRVAGIVENEAPDGVAAFDPPNHAATRIAEHVVRFLLDERRAGRIPQGFLPLQSGVGNVANAVMGVLGDNPDIPPFSMYTEVFQDANVDLMERGRMVGASASALTLSAPQLERIYDNMDFFASRIVLRPSELSNSPEIIRRLGIIAMNTALEVDIYGHVNSTHVCGTGLMNGIGGSGDFTRNAYLSFFMCPSTAKGGRISAIVPMVTHADHNEHSVQIVVTEQGLADLRGLGPIERARRLISCCAHPAYRDYLSRYLETAGPGHLRHDLSRAFELHRNLMERGEMLSGVALGD
jgi:acetyl-CoA hydrolase